MPAAPALFIATDDERLQKKVRSLEQKFSVHLPVLQTLDGITAHLNAAQNQDAQWYAFVDLHAQTFDGYALARQVKEAFPAVHIVGSSLGIDLDIVQKSKLFRIDSVLQRYRFEELLRKIAESMATENV